MANPSEEDIRKIRHDVLEVITRAGAAPETVDIAIEIDSQKNILRAIATGATELRTKDRNAKEISDDEKREILAEGEKTSKENVEFVAGAGKWNAYYININKKSLFGLINSKKKLARIIDNEGVIRLQKNVAKIETFKKPEMHSRFKDFVESMTEYSDAGETLPKTYLYFGQKQVDCSGVINKEQLTSLIDMELEFVSDDEDIIAVVSKD